MSGSTPLRKLWAGQRSMTDYKWIRRLAETLFPARQENSRTDSLPEESSVPGGAPGNARERYSESGSERSMIRKHFVFHGRVQGVGFRYRARQAAETCGCTGWVINEYDGSVTMELQGTEEQIDLVLQEIRQWKYVQVERMDVKQIPVEPGEKRFRTGYY